MVAPATISTEKARLDQMSCLRNRNLANVQRVSLLDLTTLTTTKKKKHPKTNKMQAIMGVVKEGQAHEDI